MQPRDPVLGLLYGPPAVGKCLGRDTPVLMHDGRIVAVQDVRVGDVLMGPDSGRRVVTNIASGFGPLYRVVPNKGDPWICNDVHVLTIIDTDTGKIIDVPLNEFRAWPAWRRERSKLFVANAVEFSSANPLPIDPYFLGVWFGDGRRSLDGIRISKPDREIEEVCRLTAEAWGLRLTISDRDRCPTYSIVGQHGWINPLLQTMREVVGDATRVPFAYRIASITDRRQFLAGILDTDGYCNRRGFEIMQDRPGVADDVAFIARSLGLRVTRSTKIVDGKMYARLYIFGDLTQLPIRIPRKKPAALKRNTDPRRTGFFVEPIGDGEFFGFTLTGDGRFLLGDFTVTHNTADLGFAFPLALWIAAPGATAPLESVCGYRPKLPPIDIDGLEPAFALIDALSKDTKRRAQIDAIVIDDLTLYIERSIRRLQMKNAGSANKYAVWDGIRNLLLDLRDKSRRAGIHIFMNAHEQPPRMHNGARIRGGPSSPGAGSENISAACDVVLRAVPNSGIPIGWKVEYRCTVEDQDYVSKDRYNVTPDHAPMNLGEILRAQGFAIRRHPEMAWQEEIVERVAGALVARLDDSDFVKKALTLAFDESMKRQSGIDDDTAEKRAIWTQRDAYDRAILRRAKSAYRRRLFG